MSVQSPDYKFLLVSHVRTRKWATSIISKHHVFSHSPELFLSIWTVKFSTTAHYLKSPHALLRTQMNLPFPLLNHPARSHQNHSQLPQWTILSHPNPLFPSILFLQVLHPQISQEPCAAAHRLKQRAVNLLLKRTIWTTAREASSPNARNREPLQRFTWRHPIHINTRITANFPQTKFCHHLNPALAFQHKSTWLQTFSKARRLLLCWGLVDCSMNSWGCYLLHRHCSCMFP